MHSLEKIKLYVVILQCQYIDNELTYQRIGSRSIISFLHHIFPVKRLYLSRGYIFLLTYQIPSSSVESPLCCKEMTACIPLQDKRKGRQSHFKANTEKHQGAELGLFTRTVVVSPHKKDHGCTKTGACV